MYDSFEEVRKWAPLFFSWDANYPILFNLKTKTLESEKNLCKMAYRKLAYFIRLIID